MHTDGGNWRTTSSTTVDCADVLRAGVVEEPECEQGSWGYRVQTQEIVIVIAFRSDAELSVVTTWRVGKP